MDEYEPPEHFGDDGLIPLVKNMTPEMKAIHLRALAENLYQYSIPQNGGIPTMSPQEAFSYAEALYDEAQRRGY